MSEVWHQVFYRNGKHEPIFGEAELARVLARKVPAVIYHEAAILHRCQHCDREGPWTSDWLCYPVLAKHAEHIQAKAGESKEYLVCSKSCWDDLLERTIDPPSWMNCNREPRDQDRQRALYAAMRGEEDRKREAKEYRKVPMPEWLGNGFCKWCNQPMRPSDKPRYLWHAACAEAYLLATDLNKQLKYLIKRDGPICAMPGCERRGGEVDHRRPLWSIRHLAPMIRRVFYGPFNLWLLCNVCHAAKTKREAAERAEKRSQAE